MKVRPSVKRICSTMPATLLVMVTASRARTVPTLSTRSTTGAGSFSPSSRPSRCARLPATTFRTTLFYPLSDWGLDGIRWWEHPGIIAAYWAALPALWLGLWLWRRQERVTQVSH